MVIYICDNLSYAIIFEDIEHLQLIKDKDNLLNQILCFY